MTHKERQLAAIRHQVPDRVPADAMCFENMEAVAAMLDLPVDAERIYDRLGIDGRIVAAGAYAGPCPTGPQGETLTHWGTLEKLDYGTSHWYPLAQAATVAEVERHPWPDPARFDFAAAAAQARRVADEYAVRGPYWTSGPLFCFACNLMGMEEAMVKMATEPAVFEACVEHIFRFSTEYVARFMDACGDALDILYLADDFASQKGLMFSPELWRRFFLPRYAELFRLGKDRGKPIWFHSCGDITAVLPDLIEIGLNVWETVQLHCLPMSPKQLKRQFGRHLCFFGGISTQHLPFGTPAQIREEVDRTVSALGEGGGYICGPDHHVKPDAPAANTIALFDAAMEFRRPGYTTAS